jgi:hypothetical protein
MVNRIVNFFTSLRLTVACLAMALVLVFVGTLAQVQLGLYVTQEKYFRSLFVFWTPGGSDWKIPVWPGGYLLGGVLLVNLLAAHIKRFKWSWKKSGIFLTHAGLILLLVGQFLTEVFQVESSMRLEERGPAKTYSEDARKNELAIVDVSNPDQDKVVVIPESILAGQKEIRLPELPFTLRVKDYFENSFPAGPMQASAGRRLQATEGIGQSVPFDEKPITAKMSDENKPAAVIEVVTDKGSLGQWTVTTWVTKFPWITVMAEDFFPNQAAALRSPQQFTHDGRTYQIALRPIRYYKQHSIQLLDFTHAKYRGTTIPKDYSSQIQLTNPKTGESREVKIYMNNPLRYGGETYYQASFEPGDTVSVLQVVRNPAWLTPYFSCTLVGLGLTVQFLMHLFGFLKKSVQQAKGKPVQARQPAVEDNSLEPAGAAAGSSKAFRASAKRRNS